MQPYNQNFRKTECHGWVLTGRWSVIISWMTRSCQKFAFHLINPIPIFSFKISINFDPHLIEWIQGFHQGPGPWIEFPLLAITRMTPGYFHGKQKENRSTKNCSILCPPFAYIPSKLEILAVVLGSVLSQWLMRMQNLSSGPERNKTRTVKVVFLLPP